MLQVEPDRIVSEMSGVSHIKWQEVTHRTNPGSFTARNLAMANTLLFLINEIDLSSAR